MRDELIETLDYAIDNATKSKEHGGRAQPAASQVLKMPRQDGYPYPVHESRLWV